MKMATGYPSIDQTHKQGEHFFERHPIIPNISIYSALCILSNSYRNDVAINCHGLNATFSYGYVNGTQIKLFSPRVFDMWEEFLR